MKARLTSPSFTMRFDEIESVSMIVLPPSFSDVEPSLINGVPS